MSDSDPPVLDASPSHSKEASTSSSTASTVRIDTSSPLSLPPARDRSTGDDEEEEPSLSSTPRAAGPANIPARIMTPSSAAATAQAGGAPQSPRTSALRMPVPPSPLGPQLSQAALGRGRPAPVGPVASTSAHNRTLSFASAAGTSTSEGNRLRAPSRARTASHNPTVHSDEESLFSESERPASVQAKSTKARSRKATQPSMRKSRPRSPGYQSGDSEDEDVAMPPMAAQMGATKKGKKVDDDDEVEPEDRGIALIRRRMKERKGQKKQEDKLRAAEEREREQQRMVARDRRAAQKGAGVRSSSVRDSTVFSEGEYDSAGPLVRRDTMQSEPGDSYATTDTETPYGRSPHTSGHYDDWQASKLEDLPDSMPASALPTPGAKTRASSAAGFRERDVFDERFGVESSADARSVRDSQAIESAKSVQGDDATRHSVHSQAAEEDDEEEEHDAEEDDDDNRSEVSYTLKDRQDAINIEHPFGLPLWKPALYKKSRSVARNAEAALHADPTNQAPSNLLPGNLLWALLFGLPLMVVSTVVSIVLSLVPWGGRKYGRVILELGLYLFWPFGRYVETVDEDGGAKTTKVLDGYDEIEDGDSIEDEEDGERDLENDGRTWGRTASRKASTTGTVKAESVRRMRESSSTVRHTDYGAINDDPKNPSSGSETLVTDNGSPRRKLDDDEDDDEIDSESLRRKQLRVRALGRLSYWLTFYLIVAPLMLTVCTLCWFFVFTIPMAKLTWVLLKHLSREPLALHFRYPPPYSPSQQDLDNGKAPLLPPKLKTGFRAPKRRLAEYEADRAAGRIVGSQGKILLCTYRAVGWQYYKYTVDGINILFINLMPLIFFVILAFFAIRPGEGQPPLTGFLGVVTGDGFLFVTSLLSVIPLSYFIGMAVASISAQSSIGMGAVINATFGSVIEILLYSFALKEGKADLVEGSIVGSLLAGVLLMPGLSMIGGAVRRKEQRFNARSAGVTSTMLIMAIIGTLTPTLFYETYGSFQLTCTGCPPSSTGQAWQCQRCSYQHVNPVDDPFYQDTVKTLGYYCAVILVVSYLVGLWFSLRTHASQIWQNAQSAAAVPQTGLPPPASQRNGRAQQQQDAFAAFAKALPGNVRQPVVTPGGIQIPASERPMSGWSALPTPNPFQFFARRASQVNPDTSAMAMHQEQSRSSSDTVIGPQGRPSDANTLTLMYNDTRKGAGAQPSVLHLNLGDFANTGLTPASIAIRRRESHMSLGGGGHGHTREISHGATVSGGGGEEAHGGHDAPNWSRAKSASVLLACTVLYAAIAEILVDVVDVVLQGSAIPEKFLGITLFALVPNTTEFMNAISFAINGNIALSMEIGSAYAIQVCLLQIPAMVAFTAWYSIGKESMAHRAFTLVFPRWDVIAILFSVFLLTYTYIEARANYFRGTTLCLSYLALLGGFYFAPGGLDTEDDPLFLFSTAGSTLTSLQATFYSLFSH